MSESAPDSPSKTMRDRLLPAMLDCAAEQGWNAGAVRAAAAHAGLDAGALALAAPGGSSDPAQALAAVLIEDWAEQADAHTEAVLGSLDLADMRIRDRIREAVRIRISYLAPHRHAARAALRASLAPWRAGLAPRIAFAAADAIWRACGDRATDWNWYSKRLILSGVIAATVAAWIESEDEEEAWPRLDRAIDGVMRIESVKKRCRAFTARFPDPLDILGRRSPSP